MVSLKISSRYCCMYHEHVCALCKFISPFRRDKRFAQLAHCHEDGREFCIMFHIGAPSFCFRNRKCTKLRFDTRLFRGVPSDERSVSPRDLVIVALLRDESIEAEQSEWLEGILRSNSKYLVSPFDGRPTCVSGSIRAGFKRDRIRTCFTHCTSKEKICRPY